MTGQQILDSILPEPNGCWLWTRALDHKGYGSVNFQRKTTRVHRLVYTLLKGPIPEGLELDHKCRVKRCVNPDHLEPVTREENIRRADVFGLGFAAKNRMATHCYKGHEFTASNIAPANRGKSRRCRICYNAYLRAWKARKRVTA